MAKTDPTTLYRSFKFRIYPNRTQQAAINELLAHLAELYNACLQQRIEAYRRQRIQLTKFEQCRELAVLRREMPTPWSQRAQRGAISRLDRAFEVFFRKRRAGQKAGLPRFRSALSYDTIEHEERNGWYLTKRNKLAIKGVGELRVKWHRALPSKPRTCKVTRRGRSWWAIFQCEVEPNPLPATGKNCGIDFGLSTLVAMSDGTRIERPRLHAQAAAKARRIHRSISRRAKGSTRRRKACWRLGRHVGHVHSQRLDFSHKIAARIVNAHDLIAIERLQVRAMSRGWFSTHVQDAGWALLTRLIVEKAERAARVTVMVEPRGTTQKCSGCGIIVPKTLAMRVHECGQCGLVLDRDHNAALNILRAGEALCAKSKEDALGLAQEAA